MFEPLFRSFFHQLFFTNEISSSVGAWYLTNIALCLWSDFIYPYLPELEYLIANPCHGLFSKKKTPGGFELSNLSEVSFVGRDFPNVFTRITWKSKQNPVICLFLETQWWKKLWEGGPKLVLLLALSFGRRTHWLGDCPRQLLGLPMKISGFYDFFRTQFVWLFVWLFVCLFVCLFAKAHRDCPWQKVGLRTLTCSLLFWVRENQRKRERKVYNKIATKRETLWLRMIMLLKIPGSQVGSQAAEEKEKKKRGEVRGVGVERSGRK